LILLPMAFGSHISRSASVSEQASGLGAGLV